MGNACCGGDSTIDKPLPAAPYNDSGSKQTTDPKLKTSGPWPIIQLTSELQVFTIEQLGQATDNWSAKFQLGEGGFGKVYKGFFQTPRDNYVETVAIKRLAEGGMQGTDQWIVEIQFLGRLQHENLVRLIGYSQSLGGSVSGNCLIYEYVPLRSLDYHLFAREREIVRKLGWFERVKVAVGAAKGLEYLHSEEFNVIHRDFKAANILLTEDYTAKLSDFGLAKDTDGRTHVSTNVMGTLGYLDPSYAQTGRLTKKSDVYAFGVVLLELLTGKKAMGKNDKDQMVSLVNWCRPFIEGPRRLEVEKILDNRLEEPCPRQVAKVLAISARHCVNPESDHRPDMSVILAGLIPLLDVKFFRRGVEEPEMSF